MPSDGEDSSVSAQTLPTASPHVSPQLSGSRVLTAACGWSHSAIVVESRQEAQRRAAGVSEGCPPLARGDIDGLFGQLLGTGIQFCCSTMALSRAVFDAEMFA